MTARAGHRVLAVMGWGLVSPAGASPGDLARALSGAGAAADVSAMYPDPLPSPRARALVDFDVRAELGRKGTSSFDRRTALTVVACGRALADAGLAVTDENRRRTGVVLATTAGSVRSSVDYAVETYTQDKPYMVNPALFPNTVMNCAAGQSAIWYGLNGVNATVAGGPVAFLAVLRYCVNAFRCGQADALLAGGVEEFTPHTAWMSHASRRTTDVPVGEGGAVFVLRPGDTRVRGRDGEVLGVAIGFCPTGWDPTEALAGCVRRALLQARVDPAEVALVAAGGGGELAERATWRSVADGLGQPDGAPRERLRIEETAGDCQAATGALELAAILARHRLDAGLDGRISMLAARSREGAVGAAVVRGWSRGADSG